MEVKPVPRNCLWCIHSQEWYENVFYCGEFEIFLNKPKASVRRNCESYEASWCRADDYDLEAPEVIHQQELAKYQKRMAGDWS